MNLKNITSSALEAVDNEYSNRNYWINITIPEFSCVCPRSGLPDYAKIEIKYIPNKKIVELKSLKLYIVQYRDVGVFHEHVTNKILDDLVQALAPRHIIITGIFNARGGIQTTISVEWENNI
tara:strand:- start:204 stop:569 length:366 start_codon:yes stop_codon:yes gene_type:complete